MIRFFHTPQALAVAMLVGAAGAVWMIRDRDEAASLPHTSSAVNPPQHPVKRISADREAHQVRREIRRSQTAANLVVAEHRLPTAAQFGFATIPHQESPVVAVDFRQPGHSIHDSGTILAVKSFQHTPKSVAPVLELVPISNHTSVTEETTEVHGKPSELASQVHANPSALASRSYANPRSGLTYEQELFRTKWGWHAFDQAQRAVSELKAEH